MPTPAAAKTRRLAPPQSRARRRAPQIARFARPARRLRALREGPHSAPILAAGGANVGAAFVWPI